MDVDFGWFADVIHFGDYPERVKKGKIAVNLIPLTAEEQKMLKGSYDYMGVTLYTGKYARSNGDPLGWRVSTIGPDGK
jgi:beta-glucosidase